MLDHAIIEQEALPYDGRLSISGSDEKKKVDDYRVDESESAAAWFREIFQ